MQQDAIVSTAVGAFLPCLAAAWMYSKLRPADPGEPAHLLPGTWRSFAVNHPWCVLPCHGSCAVAHVILAAAHFAGLAALAAVLLSGLPEGDEPFLTYLFALLPSLLMTPITHSVLSKGFWKYSFDSDAKQRFVDPKESPTATSSSSDSAGWRSPGHLDYLFKDLDSTALQLADGVAFDPQDPQEQEPAQQLDPSTAKPGSSGAAEPATPRCLPVSQFFSEDAQGFVFAVEDDVDAEDMSVGALSTSLDDEDASDCAIQKESVPNLVDEIDALLLNHHNHTPSALPLAAPEKHRTAAFERHHDVVTSELVRLAGARPLSWLSRTYDGDITLPDVNYLSLEGHEMPTAVMPAKPRSRRYIAPVHPALHRSKAYVTCSIFAAVALALLQLTVPCVASSDRFPHFLLAALSLDIVVVQPLAVILAFGFRWLTTEPGELISWELHPIDGQWRLIPLGFEHEVDVASDCSG